MEIIMPANTYFIVKVTKFDLDENILNEHFEVHDSNGFVAGPFEYFEYALNRVNELTAEADLGPTAEYDAGPTAEYDAGPTAEPDAGPTAEYDAGPTAETDAGPTAEPEEEPSYSSPSPFD